ncbi:MAG: metal-dependent transcriptional regulator [Saprospiraceae bacterium]|nr:metal-dependent transcriptional regulator [Saprospiraceae bacterium]
MSTTVKENYLKALYFLDEQAGKINLTELSKHLGVSKPTANNMIKKLEEHGWVNYRKYKPVMLTEEGRRTAALIIRKHRLTEMFLHQVMGFGWEEVHEIAEQMEHIQSPTLFARMDEMLNYPTVDPHGSPIPNDLGEVITQKYQALSEIPTHQKVHLHALARSSKELLHYLNQLNIQLGTTIEILQTEAFDNSLLISCDGKEAVMISQKVAKSLLVK